MSHECTIGLLDVSELVTTTHLKNYIANRVRHNNYLREIGVESKILYYEEWSLRDYADRRKRTNLTHFNHCPDCGKKIDWGAIRKEETK